MRPSPAELEEAYHVIEQERFWSKVDLDGPIHPLLKTKCWLWLGAHQMDSGHGVFRLRGTNMPAGKAALILSDVEVTAGLNICHHCDNPPCIRPDHLFQGTDKENAQDMAQKGRSSWGEKHYRAKLTNADARSIIQEYAAGALAKDLAAKYRVSPSAVGALLTGRQWKQLTGGASVSHGRGRGERAHAAKLTEAVVLEIRQKYATGKLGNLSQVARDLGVQRHAIYALLSGKTWAHIKL
jgi:hypothetical protein